MRKILWHYITIILLVGKAAASYADGQVEPGSIVVITSHEHPVVGLSLLASSQRSTVQIYYLDAIDRLEHQLSQSLPADVTKATPLLKTRIADIGPAVFEQQLREAYQPLLLMMKFQLDRYPVIVFDDRAVIYGMTELPKAIQRYQAWATASERRHHD